MAGATVESEGLIMSDIELTAAKKPFATKAAAAMRLSTLSRREGVDGKVVETEGGWGIKILSKDPEREYTPGVREVLKAKDKDPNFAYRVVSEDPKNPGRIKQMQDRDWELCDNPLGDPKAGVAGSIGGHTSRPVGNNVTGHLMRIPREYYEQNKDAQDKAIRETENGIMQREESEGLVPMHKK